MKTLLIRLVEWLVVIFVATAFTLGLLDIFDAVSRYLLSPPAFGAPVPSPRPKPAVQLKPGNHILVWSGMRWQMTLTKEGGYECQLGPGTVRFYGSWSWCSKQRIMVINETTDGSGGGIVHAWTTYVIRMPDKQRLCGATIGKDGSDDVAVSIEEVVVAKKGK